MGFTFDDGLGTYLRLWTDWKWVYVSLSMTVETTLVTVLLYLLVGWGVYRWKRRTR